MIIKTLVENTSISENFNSEHGLSFYIETDKHKLLFDLGGSELFIENAKKLKVDLSEVDVVVISHGHRDHGGGLKAFLQVNKKAKIYLNEKAFGKYYSKRAGNERKYIGLDEGVEHNHGIIYVGDYLKIDNELELFSGVKGSRLYPSANEDLFMKLDNQYVQDDFSHEQNLIIKVEGSKRVLVAGCAHNGIVNIIEHIKIINNELPTHVLGGFHLYKPSSNKSEEIEKVIEIGEYLRNTGSRYYTCHCTGIEAYNILKSIVGKNMEYLSTGRELII